MTDDDMIAELEGMVHARELEIQRLRMENAELGAEVRFAEWDRAHNGRLNKDEQELVDAYRSLTRPDTREWLRLLALNMRELDRLLDAKE